MTTWHVCRSCLATMKISEQSQLLATALANEPCIQRMAVNHAVVRVSSGKKIKRSSLWALWSRMYMFPCDEVHELHVCEIKFISLHKCGAKVRLLTMQSKLATRWSMWVFDLLCKSLVKPLKVSFHSVFPGDMKFAVTWLHHVVCFFKLINFNSASIQAAWWFDNLNRSPCQVSCKSFDEDGFCFLKNCQVPCMQIGWFSQVSFVITCN